MRARGLIFGWLVFFIATSFYSYEYLLRILPGAMAVDLMQVHRINTLQLGLLSNVYYLTYGLMQIPVGVTIDFFGPKRLLLLAVLSCIVGSFLFSADGFITAFIGRFLVGFGSAFAFVGVLRMATLWLPAEQFALATGLITTVGMLGGILGDVILGHLVDKAGWQTTVVVSALIGIPIFIVLAVVPNRYTFKHHHHHKPPSSLVELFAGLKLVISKPTLWLNAIVGCLLYIPLSAFAELWGVPYLQTVYALPRSVAVNSISWLLLGWAIGAPLVGLLGTNLRRQLKLVVTGSFLALILILVFLNLPLNNLMTLNAVLLVFGILCSGQILIMVFAKEFVPSEYSATAMAFTNTLIMLGGFFSQPLIGMFVMASSRDMIHRQITLVDVNIYRHAMYVVPVALGLALLILLHQIYRIYINRPANLFTHGQ